MNEIILLEKRVAELEKANRELEHLFNSMADLVFVLDNNNTIVRANSACASFFNTEPQDIIGRKCYELVHKFDKPCPKCPFENTKRDKNVRSGEVSDPEIGLSLLVTVSPIFNDDKEMIGAVHVAKDVTEYMKLDELKSEFISTVSHELRTPLSIIKESISLVLDRVSGEINERQSGILDISKRNIDRLARILDSLLDIAKIETGEVELKRSFIDISDVVKRAAGSFESKIKDKGLEMRLDIGNVAGNVWADADKITQVLVNLIGNAIKFTDSGRIDVSCKDTGDAVECSVSDTGIGISGNDLPKVFSKFQQFGRTPGPGDKGTGLGLSIAKSMVDMHSGAIWVESESGKGSRFTFKLYKHTPQSLFREYVSEAVRKAAGKGAEISIIAVNSSLTGKDISGVINKRFNDIIRESASLIKNTLRERSGDGIVSSGGETIIILSNCGKENAAKTQGRLEKVVGKYLADQRASDAIRITYGRATYPDDAKSGPELIEKARSACGK